MLNSDTITENSKYHLILHLSSKQLKAYLKSKNSIDLFYHNYPSQRNEKYQDSRICIWKYCFFMESCF